MRRITRFPGKDEKLVLQVDMFWIPTKESAEKIILIEVECALNKPLRELNGRTPFEDAIIHKNASGFFRVHPYLRKTPLFKYYQRMLTLSDRGFTYQSVYSKTGGVLNIFHPKIKESMDNELKRLLERCKDKKEAISIWKDTPSELWSGLPPKLVWAGGGEVEGRLLTEFLERLTDRMEGKRFGSQGDCLISALKTLREWQVTPNRVCFGETPMDAIIEERRRIYESKASFLKKAKIETDFV